MIVAGMDLVFRVFTVVRYCRIRAMHWHKSVIGAQPCLPAWFMPLSGRFYLLIAAAMLMLAAAVNYDIRARQFDAWQAHPAITHLDGMPMFSNADAPYFLGIAAALKRGETAASFEAGRNFSNGAGTSRHERHEGFATVRDAPLLSVIIAIMAEDASPAAIVKAGHALIPVTAALTAVMIAFTFGIIGYWGEGAVAALGGGLSFAYLSRSAAGRIDTDQLNLGLVYLLFGLAYWVGTIKGRIKGLLAAGIMGVAAYVFMWWYAKPELIIMPVIALL